LVDAAAISGAPLLLSSIKKSSEWITKKSRRGIPQETTENK